MTFTMRQLVFEWQKEEILNSIIQCLTGTRQKTFSVVPHILTNPEIIHWMAGLGPLFYL